MMIKPEILDFIKSNNGAEIALLQSQFGLTYRQAKSVIDDLLSTGELVFKEGVRYEYVGRQPLSQGRVGDKNNIIEGADYDDENDLRLRALQYVIERNQASVSMLQRRFPIGYMRACKLIDWMEDQCYVSQPEGPSPRKVLITREEFEKLCKKTYIDEAIHFDPEEDEDEEDVALDDDDLDDFNPDDFSDILEGDDLDKFFDEDEDEDEDPDKAKRASEANANKTLNAVLSEFGLQFDAEAQRLIEVLKLVIEIKKQPISTDVMPLHPSWSDEDEFEKEVLNRFKGLIISDKKMGQSGAVKKAETLLEGVRDTHDRKMMEVYERLVYELKNTGNYLYRQLKKQFLG